MVQIKMIEGVNAGGKPRFVGDVVEVSESEARQLFALQAAVPYQAEPVATAGGGGVDEAAAGAAAKKKTR